LITMASGQRRKEKQKHSIFGDGRKRQRRGLVEGVIETKGRKKIAADLIGGNRCSVPTGGEDGKIEPSTRKKKGKKKLRAGGRGKGGEKE